MDKSAYPPPPSNNNVGAPQGYPPAPGYPPPSGYPVGGNPPPGYPPPVYGAPPNQGYPPPNYPQPQIYPPPGSMQAIQVNPPSGILVPNAIPVNAIYGPFPVLAYCNHCNQNITTRTEAHIGCMVWLMFLIFYLVMPCISCVPFCVTSWYDVSHYCPNCSRLLGAYCMV